MSKLQDLINELCPDGVEYIMLGELTNYGKERISTSELNENNYVSVENLLQNKGGKTSASSVPVEGRMIKYNSGDILIGNIRPYLKKIWLSDCCGGTNGDVLVIQVLDKNLVTPKFLYYVLSSDTFFYFDTQNSKGGKMPRGDKSLIMTYLVPVPPFEIQAEIVRILDTFIALIDNLQTEKGLRKKQFKYYQEILLTFDDGVEYKTLGETIVSLNTGLNPRRFFKLNTDNANNYYVTIRELQNNKIVFSEKTDRMNDDALKLCNNRSNLEAGDVLFSGTGTIGVTALIEKLRLYQ